MDTRNRNTLKLNMKSIERVQKIVSFELTLLLLVFTQAFHKISIQTSIKNIENMPQVTLSNNSAISIDNEACFLCYLWTFGWIFYGTLE